MLSLGAPPHPAQDLASGPRAEPPPSLPLGRGHLVSIKALSRSAGRTTQGPLIRAAVSPDGEHGLRGDTTMPGGGLAGARE